MTLEGLLLLIKTKLQAATWTGGLEVFHDNSVIISAGPETSALARVINPIAIIRPLDATADPDEPSFFRQNIEVVIMTSVAGDALGQHTLMGANRTANSSKGAGLIQIREAVLDVIDKLNAADGVVLQHVFSGAATPIQLSNSTWVNAMSLTFESYINH